MLLKSNVFYILSIVTVVMSGCASNAPFVLDPAKDMRQLQVVEKKIPIKAGIYLSDDLKQYLYTQQKTATPFQMRVGEYLSSITMPMGSTMFDDVISVNSLPPYDDSYRPDVEAVIKPEILFYYANTVGAFSGYIEAKMKLRVTVYDLGGNILWQDEAIGESKSNDMDFVNSFLTGMAEVDGAGYQAVLSAAAYIINNFYAKPPQEFLSLLEIKAAENLTKQGALPDAELFKKLYEKGQLQYNKKNYYQSLYLFAKASNINPDEPAALFYTGASYTHTGDKLGALKKFTDIIKKKPSGQQALDSKKWIQRLEDPLKIEIIDSSKSNSSALNNEVIQDTLIDSGMYKIINTVELVPSDKPVTSSDFPKFLDKCSKKGIKAIVLYDVDSSSEKNQSNHYSDEDDAMEHRVRISAKVYSTKKKQLKTEVQINETSSTIQEQAVEDEIKARQQLLHSGAKKLVLQLLKNDIF